MGKFSWKTVKLSSFAVQSEVKEKDETYIQLLSWPLYGYTSPILRTM